MKTSALGTTGKMARATQSDSKQTLLKWGNIVALIVMIGVNIAANVIPLGGVTTGEVSEAYPSLFTPAPMTFSIWGVIYALMVLFAVYQFGAGKAFFDGAVLRRDIGPWFMVSRKVVYLTFDDGPSTNTPRILEILSRYGACATWFIKGDQGEIAYVKDIWQAGNQLAIHTYLHRDSDVYASQDAYWGDVESAGNAIKAQVGFAPRLLRFPGGSINDFNKAICGDLIEGVKQRGCHYFDWNIACGDGGNPSIEQTISNVVDFAAGCNSCCVLMHDSAAKDNTVEALPSIIEWFIENDFEFDVLVADSYGYHF